MKRSANKVLLCSAFCFFSSILFIHAQVTTATLSGFVKDAKNAPLASATVTVEYPDAGIKLSQVTKADGRFTIPNLRVGGPYRVTVNHVSYKEAVSDNIYLELGLNNTVEFSLQEKTTELTNVTVTSRSRIFDNKRTGASTNINNRQIRTLPTITRSTEDSLRLNSSAASTYEALDFAAAI